MKKVSQTNIRRLASKYKEWLVSQTWFKSKIKNTGDWLAPINKIIDQSANSPALLWDAVVDHWQATNWNEESFPDLFEELYDMVDEYRSIRGVDGVGVKGRGNEMVVPDPKDEDVVMLISLIAKYDEPRVRKATEDEAERLKTHFIIRASELASGMDILASYDTFDIDEPITLNVSQVKRVPKFPVDKEIVVDFGVGELCLGLDEYLVQIGRIEFCPTCKMERLFLTSGLTAEGHKVERCCMCHGYPDDEM